MGPPVDLDADLGPRAADEVEVLDEDQRERRWVGRRAAHRGEQRARAAGTGIGLAHHEPDRTTLEIGERHVDRRTVRPELAPAVAEIALLHPVEAAAGDRIGDGVHPESRVVEHVDPVVDAPPDHQQAPAVHVVVEQLRLQALVDDVGVTLEVELDERLHGFVTSDRRKTV
jgi:hypothetical protein